MTTSSISVKILFIITWNVAGELQSLKYITKGLNAPWKQMNAAFHSSPSLIWMLLYPYLRSIFINSLDPWSLSTSCPINGKG